MPEQSKTLTGRDAAIIWHPYTQHKSGKEFLPIIKGEGVYLIHENGGKYIDAISSWWTNIHGHSHPYIAKCIGEQAGQLEHVIFAGCTHEPAVRLAEQLLPLLPGDFAKVFYSDNGSTAVEVALKMAIQFHRNKSAVKRKKILALKHSYHGDTFGAMSVSERGVFTIPFDSYLFEVIFIDMESGSETLPTINWEEIACFIYEPLLQGAGGMKMYDPDYLNELLIQCKANDVICIADEVMTGFYRTGVMFSSEYVREKPDIICLSKGLTGGSLPLAITACVQGIFDAFLSNDLSQTFFHGHSYTANPIACAAGLASLELLLKKDCLDSISRIVRRNNEWVKSYPANPKVSNIRCLGTVLAFELNSRENEYLSSIKDTIIKFSLERGVLIRPLGNTVYIMPPYCINNEELDKLYELLEEVIKQV